MIRKGVEDITYFVDLRRIYLKSRVDRPLRYNELYMECRTFDQGLKLLVSLALQKFL